MESSGSTATAALLRTAGRTPPLPCAIVLDSGQCLQIEQVLRILPGKRLTARGLLEGRDVVAKLFIAAEGSARHWQRELDGVTALLAHRLPTPALLASGKLSAGGHFLLCEFIHSAQEFSVTMDRPALARLFFMLGRLHAQGLIHADAHLGNFLCSGDEVYILDGDAIRTGASPADRVKNLALLLAQWPPAPQAGDGQEELLTAYRAGNPGLPPDPLWLEQTVARLRQQRLDGFLKKCRRDCSAFKLEHTLNRQVIMVRDAADFLAPILAAPDRWLAAGLPLKQGRTATLALIEHQGRKLVIKRYNIKGALHALSRCWRPSRAAHAWLAGHRLGFLGIATPRPLALIEQRYGPLRAQAWLITEYCPGTSLVSHLGDGRLPDPATLNALENLFAQLTAARISHGDLKATNVLWHDGHPVLIDLDALRQHARAHSFRRAWKKDRARFLRNWPRDSELHAALTARLPDSEQPTET